MVISKILLASKSAHVFCSKSFRSNLLRSLKSASWFQAKFWQAIGFILQSPFFMACISLGKNQVSKIGYIFSAKVLASLVRAFSLGSLFLAKSLFCKVSFQQRFQQVLGFGILSFQKYFPKQSRACKKLWRV